MKKHLVNKTKSDVICLGTFPALLTCTISGFQLLHPLFRRMGRPAPVEHQKLLTLVLDTCAKGVYDPAFYNLWMLARFHC